MTRSPLLAAVAVAVLAALPGPARAQDTCPCPQEPPPGWRTTLGAGLAYTSGNTDTQNLNLTFNTVYDPKTRNLFKADGLWIRNKTDDELSAERSAFNVRDELTISGRAFAFLEVGFQRDRFKELSYFITPMAGIGYRLVDTEKVRFVVDASVGGGFEKLYDQESTADGTFKVGESVEWQISKSAKLTHGAWGLWKMADTGDAYYHFDVALSTSVTSFLEVQLSVVDDYKARPATADLEKNDVAFLANLVVKF